MAVVMKNLNYLQERKIADFFEAGEKNQILLF
jgi:hypothetical protein